MANERIVLRCGSAFLALASLPGTLSVTPSTGIDESETAGGPFTGSQTYTLQNVGTTSINWTAAKTQTWTTLSSSSGTLAPGAVTTVTFSVNSGADALSSGAFTDTATFTNTTNGNGTTARTVSLTISDVGGNASAVIDNGQTLNFSASVRVGTFIADGSPWAVDPGSGITIDSATPAATGSGTTYRHGSMKNPLPNGNSAPPGGGDGQAYDGRNGYSTVATKAVAFPITLVTGDSLIKSESLPEPSTTTDVTGLTLQNGQSYCKKAAILTILATAPAADAFRPAYAKNATRTIYRDSDVNWGLLPSLATPASAPSLATMQSIFQHSWVDHSWNYIGRAMHPSTQMPNYGRELANWIGMAALLCCCDAWTLAQKKPIARNLIQLGIDYYGILQSNPGTFDLIAGQNWGRVFPIHFAGKLLGSSTLLNADTSTWADRQGFYEGSTQSPAQTYWNSANWLNTGTGVWAYSTPPTSANVLHRYESGVDTAGTKWEYESVHPDDRFATPYPWNPGSPQWPNDKGEGYGRTAIGLVTSVLASRILGFGLNAYGQVVLDYFDRFMHESDAINRTTIVNAIASHPVTPTCANGASVSKQQALTAFGTNAWTAFRSSY